jgi:hypothetical protein
MAINKEEEYPPRDDNNDHPPTWVLCRKQSTVSQEVAGGNSAFQKRYSPFLLLPL